MWQKILLLLSSCLLATSLAGQANAAYPPTPDHWLHTTTSSDGRQWAQADHPVWDYINAWPVPRWSASKAATIIDLGTKAQQQATAFTVYRPASGAEEQVVWTWEVEGHSQWILTDQRLADLGAIRYLNFESASDHARLSTYLHQYGPGSATSGRLHLGTPPTDRQLPVSNWEGILAECLVYERVLSATAQRQAESYLALKYGLTLQQDTAGVDYLHSSGARVWKHQLQPEFHHRLTGIGQDQHWQWSQRQAQSTASGSLLQLNVGEPQTENSSLPDSLAQDFTLIIGDNDQPLTWDSLNTTYDILQRQWLVQTWQLPAELPTQVRIEAARWEGPTTKAESYWLAIDRSGRGQFDPSTAEYYPLTSDSARGWVSCTNLHWDTDGSGSDKFALIRKKVNTPPPIATETIASWVYPNPVKAQENTYWQVWLPQAEALQVELVAANGQVLRRTNHPTDSYLQGQWQAPGPGIYWLHFRTASRQKSLKLIVQ
jgi:hypothetical protein